MLNKVVDYVLLMGVHHHHHMGVPVLTPGLHCIHVCPEKYSNKGLHHGQISLIWLLTV